VDVCEQVDGLKAKTNEAEERMKEVEKQLEDYLAQVCVFVRVCVCVCVGEREREAEGVCMCV